MYVPSDYIILSTLLSVVCCIFSPLVAAFINIPALVLSWTVSLRKESGSTCKYDLEETGVLIIVQNYLSESAHACVFVFFSLL